jgi:glycerophosphoryl diester phosphodiesterase
LRLALTFLTFFYCLSAFAQNELEIYGHRGFRGQYPENSLVGFQKAIDLEITGIELDVVVNKDGQLVISHEPYFQSEFCLDSIGNNINRESLYNIYQLNQEEISKFDCGSKYYSKFPEQHKIKSSKPLFQEFIQFLNLQDTKILLEIKSNPKEYGISQPKPEEYCKIILNELKNFPVKSNVRIMSFDYRILEELHKNDSSYPLVYLTYLPKSTSYFLKKISFSPYALGMFYPTINKHKVISSHKKQIKVFAWTVNSLIEQKKLSKIGVDGIITDYPNKIKN